VKLAKRRALITGGTRGFGLALARAFVAEGADVVLCGRDADQVREAGHAVNSHGDGRRVRAEVADVTDPVAVERLVGTAFQELGGLEILVCNAGIYGPKGPLESADWSEWCRAVTINLMGTVLPCRAVLPYFKEREYGKIILLSGGGATKGLPYFTAYAASKAAVIRFGETLAEEAREHHIDVNAVAPGALNTRLLDEVLEAGPERVGREFHDRSLEQKRTGGAPMERGAALCVFLASADSDGITGRLISAVWDPWERLPEHIGELGRSDIYTLRRIVPEDRGLRWGSA
jgi:NAD(P)-dependent dehydrogenase (short-subunit alcohol dehydrogenase family)